MGWQRPPWSGCIFLPSFHLANRASDVCQPQNQQKTNHQSHQISPSIFGRLGHFKRPSFAHAWCEDACAVWLHSSAILGSAGLGEAFGRHGWIVFCGGMVRYRILTLFILIPLLRGFYFSENILSDVHTRRCLALIFWEVVDGSLVYLGPRIGCIVVFQIKGYGFMLDRRGWFIGLSRSRR